MYLADLAKGRDNNLTLLRIIAATAVLVSHSFVLSTSSSDTEPLRTWIGMTPGTIAVDIFFVVSGFLVTASISKTHDMLDFVVARCLRIFPALWVLLLFTVLVLGPLVTTLPLDQYFDRKTAIYFFRCATLLVGISTDLPGVFASNPYHNNVNGSLWTMPWEIRCYIVLLMAWWTAFSLNKWNGRGFLALASGLGVMLYGLLLYFYATNFPAVTKVMPLLMFVLGVLASQLRHRIRLGWRGFAVAAALLCLTPHFSITGFYVVYAPAMAYAVLFLAFVPRGVIRGYNRMGDYSYGVYLYAFPIQQLLAYGLPGIQPIQMIFYAFACTMVCAILSWHVIEKRALAMKSTVIARIRTSWVPARVGG